MSGGPLSVLVAPDKFKGSLDATLVARSLGEGIRDVLGDVTLCLAPIADGGEGTIDCAVAAGFEPVPVRVRGPLGDPVDARIAVLGDRAVVELAELCGWPRSPASGPAPLDADTHGVGDALLVALDRGCTRIVLGVGGSLSTDGGLGMVRALGVRALDDAGASVPHGGGGLGRLDRLDLTGLDPRIHQVEIVLATDVDSPLLGPRGAARLFGPQKGADDHQVALLEAGLARLADRVEALAGRPLRDLAGCGAAGGTALTAVGLLGASVRSGAEVVAEMTGLEALVDAADVVVTGEGRWDEQTAAGKGPMHVVRLARAAGKPVAVVAGVVTVSREVLRASGVAEAVALVDLEPDVERCMTQAAALLRTAARELAPRLGRLELDVPLDEHIH